MKLDWNTVGREHVERACELVLEGKHGPRSQAKGIFVVSKGQQLPAKHVLRLAYLLANGMPMETKLTFSSGEGTTRRLRGMGFEVAHQAKTPAADSVTD